jgi:hypothetical protein
MDRNDQAAIDTLFRRLQAVAAQSGPRDPEAEARIAEQMNAIPGAPYFMAQTLVMQQQALDAAEAQLSQSQGRSGLMPDMARAEGTERSSSVPRAGRRAQAHQPTGFLAGAAQTALGVTGGLFLGSMLGSMFGMGGAEAGTDTGDGSAEDAADPGMDDDAGGFFDDLGI